MSRTCFMLLALLTTACATTGATFQSGVADAFPERPPYYAGASATLASRPAARVGVLPVQFQRGASQPAQFDPRTDPHSPLAALLEEMNGFLDSLATNDGRTPVRLVTGLSPARTLPATARSGIAPDVRFGCITEFDLPDADCAVRGDTALGRGSQAMKLTVGRPSPEWVSWVADAMDEAGTSYALVITLEVGQYLVAQTGIGGKKSVRLGTDNIVALPWMTSLETPVSVLQLTGVLLDRRGRAVRIGAEGVLAKRTPFLASALEAQALLTDKDVAALGSEFREDLPDRPHAWRAAMRQLVRDLTR